MIGKDADFIMVYSNTYSFLYGFGPLLLSWFMGNEGIQKFGFNLFIEILNFISDFLSVL